MYFYKAFGLDIKSEFVLPPLLLGGKGRDLTIAKRKIKFPESNSAISIFRFKVEGRLALESKSVFLKWPGVITIVIIDGKEIFVDLEKPLNEEQLFIFIVTEALGIILHQRGFYLLHGSAIVINGKSIAFIGPSGAGKSTIAAAFAKRGYTVLSDDIVAIKISPEIEIIPSYPQIKIHSNCLKELRYSKKDYIAVLEGYDKMALRNIRFSQKKHLVSNIFILDSTNSILEGTEAFVQITKYFPLPFQILKGESLKRHFEQTYSILDRAKIISIFNDKSFDSIQLLLDKIVRLSV